jgi:hypothetical protein
MTTKTPTPAQALASRLYHVDYTLERRIRAAEGDPGETPLQHGVYLALNGIRAAEDKMTSAMHWMRGDMDRAERDIMAAGHTWGAHLTGKAAEFDEAQALREAHMAALAALIGDDLMAAWKAARTAARDPNGQAARDQAAEGGEPA